MIASQKSTTERRPRRRWFRFSLRTLMVLVGVLCVWLGWLSYEARMQQKAVAVVEAAGGQVFYDYHWNPAAGEFDRALKPPTARWLRKALGKHLFCNVVGVDLVEEGRNAPQITDADLAHLARLNHLRSLRLSLNDQITDAGLDHVGRMSELEALTLQTTHVTDAGIGKLRELTNLRELDLIDTFVTRESIGELRRALPKTRIVYMPRFGRE